MMMSHVLAALFMMTLASCDIEEDEDDTKAPTPGGSGAIVTSTIKRDSLTLAWTAASDNKSSASKLKYKVVQSTTNNIDTVANIKANGTAIGTDLAGEVSYLGVSSLQPSTQYYFNLIATDEAGNEVAYSMTPATTLGAHVGVWTATCVQSKSSDGIEYQSETLTVADDGKSVQQVMTNYGSDSTCKTESYATDVAYTYTINSASTTVSGAYNIDQSFTKLTLAAKSATTVDFFKSASLCDTTDWVASIPKDCLSYIFPEKKSYDLFKVSSDLKSLYSGDDSGGYDGKSPALRPVALEATPYTFKSNN